MADNPALAAAVERGLPIIPIFIWAPDEEGGWSLGEATRNWLHRSLEALDQELRAVGSRLIFRRGPSLETLQTLVKETRASAIFWNRRYEPAVILRDTRLKESLRSLAIEVDSFNSHLLREPWEVKNQSGRPFQVFTPYWRHCLNLPEPKPPLASPAKLAAPAAWPKSIAVGDFKLLPKIAWDAGIKKAWQPGSAGAQKELQRFLKQGFSQYSTERNTPSIIGTSRLSPFLHFGEISPRMIWQGVKDYAARAKLDLAAWRGSQFLAELGWREFSHHLLFHFPQTTTEPLRPEFSKFPWIEDPEALTAWQKGMTGYPFVDAGMRELWTTGWMHNRVRMVVASFLVKDLMISWRAGAEWFWDTLVDADLAQNTLGWQWTAGCGADAAPYFRVFNPITQGEKFDPDGTYVRQWVPELARLPAKWIHRPMEAPKEVLAAAGVILGKSYPEPIISHAIARERALEAYARIRQAK